MEIPLCKDEVLEWNGSDPSGPPYSSCFHGDISLNHSETAEVLLIHKVNSNGFKGLHNAINKYKTIITIIIM